jgi:putative ATPase
MDLFEAAGRGANAGFPLAEALRPQNFDELLGQRRALGGAIDWRRLAREGRLPSLILWGPPGTGKTTFARLLAAEAAADVETLNAVEIGAKALREIGEAGRRRRMERSRRTIAFIDEIHRLNKAQQDVLLPFVEKGDLILIGATTENPSYELNAALLSRARLVVFERLDAEALGLLAERAARGSSVALDELLQPKALAAFIEHADGDARALLNGMEALLALRGGLSPSPSASDINASREKEAKFPLSPEALAEVLGGRAMRYDKGADAHHDTISAFIKSVRGSDPDAAAYYLARMLKGGEDPVFIARRLVILASEDVGNADPRGLTVAVSGLQAVELVGLPEAAISLAQVTTYLASAPKSNASYMALRAAEAEVDRSGSLPIPLALRSAKTAPMRRLGYGDGYRYSHDGPKGYVEQPFLPEALRGARFYEPVDRGFEKAIREYLAWLRK